MNTNIDSRLVNQIPLLETKLISVTNLLKLIAFLEFFFSLTHLLRKLLFGILYAYHGHISGSSHGHAYVWKILVKSQEFLRYIISKSLDSLGHDPMHISCIYKAFLRYISGIISFFSNMIDYGMRYLPVPANKVF